MNREDFREHQRIFLGSLLERARLKQREYADEESAFHNFEQAIGISLHNEREAVAYEYCTKHLQSIKDIVKHIEAGGEANGFPTQDLLDEKFGDVIVYMTLLHGMLTERVQDYNKTRVDDTPKGDPV